MPRSAIVALRGASQQDARRCLFATNTWEFLRDLGQTFGWQPRGTTYVTSSRQTAATVPTRHNYQPGDARDSKRIEAQDAVEWASALGVAKHSPYFRGMIRAHAGLAECGEGSLLCVIDEFIEFARKGEFVFSLSADADSALASAQA